MTIAGDRLEVRHPLHSLPAEQRAIHSPLSVTAVNQNTGFRSSSFVDERECLIERAQDVLSIVVTKIDRQCAYVSRIVGTHFHVAYGNVEHVSNAQPGQAIDVVRRYAIAEKEVGFHDQRGLRHIELCFE